MTLLGGIFIGCCVGFFVGGALMRERIKCALQVAVSRSAWREVLEVFSRGDA